MTVTDQKIRERVLDLTASFCVSAPAGSGKTELLIQRYLGLLSRVERPEQVLAITFTRKAAAEMRERVLQALQDAIDETDCPNTHQQTTRALAKAALATDNARQWHILRNSSQLNIKTIDSFCSALTRQMPVLSQFGGQANTTDFAGELYIEAVQELFSMLEGDTDIASDLRALLLHFDNNWEKLQALLVDMLGRREQWGDYLGVHHRPEEAEQYLHHAVTELVEDTLSQLGGILAPFAEELLALRNYAAGNLGEPVLIRFPGHRVEDLAGWRSLRALLLTADKAGKWRARVDRRNGFPAGSGEPQEYKARLKSLIESLQRVDGLLEELAGVSGLPEMESHSESWRLVLHLSRVLPLLSAQLLLVFQRRGQVDHNQVALSALDALGPDDRPTELALRLDYQLQHLLLDEFQDTAINQYQLVSRLTRGWGEHNQANPDNPRTITIVGDGMQSIYGFRNANVGLFTRAAQEGFNGVSLERVTLQSNFRSDRGIVEWVNSTFSLAFPRHDDVGRARIAYTRAEAVRPDALSPAVEQHCFRGDCADRQEAEFIASEVERGVKDDECQSIAVLARSRPHLAGILQAFQARGLSATAVDIDNLVTSPVVVDLLSLCRALLNHADTVAWLAVLRAPWCGLPLAELHLVGLQLRSASPWQVLADAELQAQLSDDGRRRLARLARAFQTAREQRDRMALRIWIEQLWLALDGPAALADSGLLEDAERFFQLLEEAEHEGVGLDLGWLESRLERLYVSSVATDSKIEVMTLHKAKGLEFDWVFIPALHKTTRANTRPLLNWDEHISRSGRRSFLLAANDHSSEDEPGLYNYLEKRRALKDLEETTRLLYVGTTRAVSRLVLTACPSYDEGRETYRPPPARSLLGRIWPVFEQQMIEHEPQLPEVPPLPVRKPGLRRVSRVAEVGAIQPPKGSETPALHPRREQCSRHRIVGTVVHQVLEKLAGDSDELPQDLADYYRMRGSPQQIAFELGLAGLVGDDISQGLREVEQAIGSVLADHQGRWILSAKHQGAASEWALAMVDADGETRHMVIDRTFIDTDSGIRWLVDYKNSRPGSDQTLEQFIVSEEQTYLAQLHHYRDALMAMGDEPVQCALYFTTLGHLHLVGDVQHGT